MKEKELVEIIEEGPSGGWTVAKFKIECDVETCDKPITYINTQGVITNIGNGVYEKHGKHYRFLCPQHELAYQEYVEAFFKGGEYDGKDVDSSSKND